MNWESVLDEGEVLRWQGRPAPRCYTFRNWRHSLFGLFLTLFSAYWQSTGLKMAEEYQLVFLALLPTPLLLVGLYLAIGHLVLARLEWERVFFAVTDRRILLQKGLFRRQVRALALDDLTYMTIRPLGETLGSLRMEGGRPENRLVFSCLEHPRIVADLLEPVIRSR